MSRFRINRLALAGAALLAGTIGASAHAHLKTSAPAADAVVTAPAEIDLAFTEGVNLRFTGLAIVGPGGAAVPVGPARLGPGGDATLVVPITGPLTAGLYTIAWHALAVDGHGTEGSFSFTVRP